MPRPGNRIPLFTQEGGIVFGPYDTKITCAYTADGGSRGKSDGCGGSFCDSSRGRNDGWCDGLPHKSADLANMMRGHLKRGQSATYNEVIVDTGFLQDHLPGSVEAVFYVAGSGPSAEGKARQVHDDMVRKFGLSAQDFPLLVLDPHASTPFAASH